LPSRSIKITAGPVLQTVRGEREEKIGTTRPKRNWWWIFEMYVREVTIRNKPKKRKTLKAANKALKGTSIV